MANSRCAEVNLSALQRHIPLRLGFEHSNPPRDALSLILLPESVCMPASCFVIFSPRTSSGMWGSLSADFSDSAVSELDVCLSRWYHWSVRGASCAPVSPFPSKLLSPESNDVPGIPLQAVIQSGPCHPADLWCFLKRFVNSLFSSTHLRRTSCFSSLGRVTGLVQVNQIHLYECLWESPSLFPSKLIFGKMLLFKKWTPLGSSFP